MSSEKLGQILQLETQHYRDEINKLKLHIDFLNKEVDEYKVLNQRWSDAYNKLLNKNKNLQTELSSAVIIQPQNFTKDDRNKSESIFNLDNYSNKKFKPDIKLFNLLLSSINNKCENLLATPPFLLNILDNSNKLINGSEHAVKYTLLYQNYFNKVYIISDKFYSSSYRSLPVLSKLMLKYDASVFERWMSQIEDSSDDSEINNLLIIDIVNVMDMFSVIENKPNKGKGRPSKITFSETDSLISFINNYKNNNCSIIIVSSDFIPKINFKYYDVFNNCLEITARSKFNEIKNTLESQFNNGKTFCKIYEKNKDDFKVIGGF
jgi:hypothetical protein